MGNMVIVIVCVDKRLQSPMYFSLGHLSAIITYIIAPLMLWGLLLTGMQTVSLTTCVAQLFLYLALGTTEFALLGAMAVDHYVAVCYPLRYNTIMNSHTCISVVTGSWVFEFLSEIWPVYATFQFTFCKSNVLDHFYCDRGQLLKLSCDDTLFRVCSVFNGCFHYHWFSGPNNCLLHLHRIHHPQDPHCLRPQESLLYVCLPLHLCCHRLWQLLVPLCETQANAGS